MEYGHVDTSGTDDDLPPSHNNRFARSGWVTAVAGSVLSPRMYNDMESEIHQLEQEAYCSILRAFKAQSDALTWEKEGLITELRKELRVSDDEHRELLTRVNADDILRRIREWRQAGGHRGATLSTPQPVHNVMPSPTAGSRKKQKTSQSASLSFSVPPRASHTQAVASSVQPSPSATKRGPGLGTGGKRPKSHLSTGPTGRGHFTNNSSGSILANDPDEAAARDPLIGRKVMTRWPEDNNFYEAVITDYNPIEGRHALVYDIHTVKETWEWVDLKEISPEDIRWVGEDPGISHLGGHGSNHFGATPLAARGRGNDQFKKELNQLQNGLPKVSDEIEILHTETLIKEVEKVFGASHPDLLEIQKAKKMLKEHEQALINVIEKLADASDSESDGEQEISRAQSMNGGWRNMHSNGIQA
ncbi:hypothetical protein NMG60_11003758 [Bertholletia excelsa]